MIKPKSIDHIVLRAERYQELVDFYCNIIGCISERVEETLGLTQLRAGSSLIDIVDVHGELGKVGGPPPTQSGNNVDHFCLQIEPFEEDKLKAYLQQLGVPCSNFENRYGALGMGRSIYLTDPAGNTVELR